jgi:hypothetical protein
MKPVATMMEPYSSSLEDSSQPSRTRKVVFSRWVAPRHQPMRTRGMTTILRPDHGMFKSAARLRLVANPALPRRQQAGMRGIHQQSHSCGGSASCSVSLRRVKAIPSQYSYVRAEKGSDQKKGSDSRCRYAQGNGAARSRRGQLHSNRSRVFPGAVGSASWLCRSDPLIKVQGNLARRARRQCHRMLNDAPRAGKFRWISSNPGSSVNLFITHPAHSPPSSKEFDVCAVFLPVAYPTSVACAEIELKSHRSIRRQLAQD